MIRVLGDIDLAEDAVAEAFAIAVGKWPETGVPPNPGGWITTTARNRAIDRLRRGATRNERHLAAHGLHIDGMEPDRDPDLDRLDDFVDVVTDDQLRLMFLCAHPALGVDAQVALILRLLAGLTTEEIANAFLVPEATLAQRIVRAKRKLHDNHASYRIPRPAELPDRLHAVLAAIYLIYNEGHSATSGQALTRTDLSTEAIRLGRTLAELMPDEPEALGLLALMLLTESRRRPVPGPTARWSGSPTRTAASGTVPSSAKATSWYAACLRRNQPGSFQVQAAIAAVHADAATYESTDSAQIITLYDHLYALRPNPVVALNRSVAIAELTGLRKDSPLLTRSTRHLSTTTSPTTPPAPTCWHRRPSHRGPGRLRQSHRTLHEPGGTRLL